MQWNEMQNLLVKEHVGLFKAANNFYISDLETDQHVLECREPNLGLLTKIFRFTDYKRQTPFRIEIRDVDNNLVVEVRRGISILLSKVQVYDDNGLLIGGFKQKLFSIGGAFTVLDENEKPICQLKGKWTGWDFKFVQDDVELAHVTKKWAGIGKELLTTADNYVLSISPSVSPDSNTRKLILAAVMCIDMVLKE